MAMETRDFPCNMMWMTRPLLRFAHRAYVQKFREYTEKLRNAITKCDDPVIMRRMAESEVDVQSQIPNADCRGHEFNTHARNRARYSAAPYI